MSGSGEEPWAIKTELGWSVVGYVEGPPSALTCHCVQVEEAKQCHFVFKTQAREVIPLEVARMFEADFREEPAEMKVSQEDRQFLKVVEENFHQRADKHFEEPLPLKDQNVSFPDNKKLALKRLFCLKRRFVYDLKFREDYNKCMTDSMSKGYAERVPEDGLNMDDGNVWFVPHHGVYHAKKGKIRVIYDCSAEYQGFSLNSKLLQGPDYVNNLVGVITRFRKDKVAISCDIQEMFNQVVVYFELLLVHQFGSLFQRAFDRGVCGLHQPGRRPNVRWDGNYTNVWSPARLMKTADPAVESFLKQTSKLVNKKQLEVQVCPSSIIQSSKRSGGRE